MADLPNLGTSMMTANQQARAQALQQAAPLAMMLAQVMGQPMNVNAVLDMADKLSAYIMSGIRTA